MSLKTKFVPYLVVVFGLISSFAAAVANNVLIAYYIRFALEMLLCSLSFLALNTRVRNIQITLRYGKRLEHASPFSLSLYQKVMRVMFFLGVAIGILSLFAQFAQLPVGFDFQTIIFGAYLIIMVVAAMFLCVIWEPSRTVPR